MGDLAKELVDMVEVFNQFQIPTDKQRDIVASGVLFEFYPHGRVKFDCIRFYKLLAFCNHLDPTFDANKMLLDLVNRRDDDYKNIVYLFLEMELKEKDKEKRIVKS